MNFECVCELRTRGKWQTIWKHFVCGTQITSYTNQGTKYLVLPYSLLDTQEPSRDAAASMCGEGGASSSSQPIWGRWLTTAKYCIDLAIFNLWEQMVYFLEVQHTKVLKGSLTHVTCYVSLRSKLDDISYEIFRLGSLCGSLWYQSALYLFNISIMSYVCNAESLHGILNSPKVYLKGIFQTVTPWKQFYTPTHTHTLLQDFYS